MLKSVHIARPRLADNFDTASRRAFERVVRRVVNLPQQPAVIVLHYYSHFRAESTFYKSAGASEWVREQGHNVCVNETCSGARAENDLAVISEYYDLPSPSMRAAVAPLIRANVTGFQVHTATLCIERPEWLGDVSECDAQLEAWNNRTGSAPIDPTSLLYTGSCSRLPDLHRARVRKLSDAYCARRLHPSSKHHGRMGAGRSDRRCVSGKRSSPRSTVQHPRRTTNAYD